MESDLNLYLDCILRPTSKESQRRSLCALADLLSTNGDLKTVFREKRGLNKLTQLLFGRENDASFQQTTMFTLSCAIDSCVSSQNVLIHKGVISLLSSLLKKGPRFPVFHSAVCLLSFVSQGNSLGQNKSRQEGVISHLTSCLRSVCPVTTENAPVWNSCLTCLSSLVNNPRNSLNQEACMEIVPLCLNVLISNPSLKDLTISIASFMRLCLSDNGSNQEKFFKIGGVKMCFEMLSRCEEPEAAWSFISLINSSPKGLLMSPDIQIACIPLLLRWISSSSSDQISIGLQALSVAVEENKRAQAALVADKNGMSCVIRCMDMGDEGTKKTARLLLQSLFTTDSGEGTHTDESDLESASHEVTKLYEKEKGGSDSAKVPPQRSVNVLKKQRTIDLNRKRKKRNVVVRSSRASWIVPPQSPVRDRKKDISESESDGEVDTPARSHSGRKNQKKSKYSRRQPSPPTPHPTPAIIPLRESSTPTISTTLNKNSLLEKEDIQDSNPQSKYIASIVSQKVEEKMSQFLDKFERVMSTSNSLASKPASLVSLTSAGKTFLNKTDCSSRECVEPRKNDIDKFLLDVVLPPPKKSLVTKMMPPIIDESQMGRSRCDLDEDDAMTVVTDISQPTLYREFFDLNPSLIPPSNDNTTADVDDSVSRHGVAAPLPDSRISHEDSGFENSSQISVPTSMEHLKANLSQQFLEMRTRESKQLNNGDQKTESGTNSYRKMAEGKRGRTIKFSEQEVANVCLGVQLYGRSWSLILARFDFHSSRTPAQLRREHGRINKFLHNRKRDRTTWTIAEVDNLKKGVSMYGCDWPKIREELRFHKSKSAADLCTKWLTSTAMSKEV